MSIALSGQALGAVIGACIVGAISFVVTVISKDVKTSEFRQAWIDGLRADLAALLAHANAIRGAAAAASAMPDAAAVFKEARPDYFGVTVAKTSILLRLNPEEAECKAIIAAISELEALIDTPDEIDIRACQACEVRIAVAAQALLKKEWSRVKRGEPLFFWTKIVGLAVFAVAGICLLREAL